MKQRSSNDGSPGLLYLEYIMKRIRQRTKLMYWFEKIKSKYRCVPYYKSIGEYRRKLQDCEQTTFDSKGRRIEKTCIDKRTKVDTRYVYKYIGDRLLKELIYRPVRRFSGEIVYKYDKQGRLRYSKLEYTKRGVSCEDYYAYDPKGRRKEWLHRWYSDDDDFWYHYTYDKNDRLVREEWWSKLCGYVKYDYKYDNLGNITEETTFMKEDNSANCRTIHSYNKEGLRVRTDYEHLTDASKGYSTYEYDKKGTLCFEKDEDEFDEDRTIYDMRGNLLLSKYYRNGVLTTTDTYTYNQHGYVISCYKVLYVCNCTGVWEVPISLSVYNYEYY